MSACLRDPPVRKDVDWAGSGQKSIENSSPTTEAEIGSRSLFGSTATDGSAAKHI